MFDYDSPKEQRPTDYTGLKIAAILSPVFFFFAFWGKEDIGLTVCIVMAMMMFAIKLRWELRRHVWFWVTIIAILALHVPLLTSIHWPSNSAPTILYSLPIGFVDFFLITGGIGLAEKFFSKDSSSDEKDE